MIRGRDRSRSKKGSVHRDKKIATHREQVRNPTVNCPKSKVRSEYIVRNARKPTVPEKGSEAGDQGQVTGDQVQYKCAGKLLL